MINEFDTIAAIATAVSNAGIGIVRISGEEALPVLSKIFEPYNQKNVMDLQSHHVYYGNIKDEEEVIDECIVIIMKGPHSYTRSGDSSWRQTGRAGGIYQTCIFERAY